MTWRAANSLLVLQHQLQAGAPRAAPPATPASAWGLIGDAEHDPSSDHTPHTFPGLGADVVTAEDFPHAPALGLDSRRVCEDIRASRDGRVKYMISQDEICSSYATSSRAAWSWGPYNPGDPNRDRHMTHGHLSVVGDSRADSWAPWATIGGPAAGEDDDDMGQSLVLPAMPGDVQRMSWRIPAVQDGAADPRAAWWCMGGDRFGARSAWRIWIGYGTSGLFMPLPGTDANGVLVLESMHPFSVQLPAGTRIVSVVRWGLNAGGTPVDPASDGAIVDALPMVPCLERS